MRRREDRALVTGRGSYLDDLRLPGTLHLALVRSPHPHARLTRLDLDSTRVAPGVVAVFAASDLDGIGPMEVRRLVPDMVVPPHPILAGDTVAAQGTPVVAVLAESAVLAEDAAERARAEWEPLAGVADAGGALKASAPRVHPGLGDNRAFERRWLAGDPARAFAEAAHVAEISIRQQRLAGVPLEPRGALAAWSTAAAELTVWTSTQAPSRVRSELARMLGIPEGSVRVVAPEVGGGFGVKGGPYREEVLVAWLARRLGRPVKWVSTRTEDFVSTHHGRGARSEGALALDATGRMTALRAQIVAPLGAYLSYTAAATPNNHARCLPGAYAVPAVDIRLRGAFTTTPPVGAYRGAGRPEAAFLIERLVDVAARAMNVDPAELRRRNLVRSDQFPFRTATGQSYDTGDYLALFDAVLAAADYTALRRDQARRRAIGEVVGIGLSAYVEPSSAGWESGLVRVERSGAVTAVTGASAHGQGHETAFAQILADELGVLPDAIAVLHGDTRGAPPGIGTFGSRSTALAGGALVLAARTVRDKGRRIAAGLLEASAEDVVLGDGAFQVRGAPARAVSWASVADVAYRGQGLPPGDTPGLEATEFFQAEAEVWSFGAVVCAVRIDPETGVIVPERLVWSDDAGTIVNPLLAEGQLHGSLAQAWAQAISEAVELDDQGQVLTMTLMDYAVPRAADVPVPELGHASTPSPRNPLGAKGIGEAGTIGIPPAVVNAVVDALGPFGVTHLDMPLTTEKVWQALRSSRQ